MEGFAIDVLTANASDDASDRSRRDVGRGASNDHKLTFQRTHILDQRGIFVLPPLYRILLEKGVLVRLGTFNALV